MNFSQSLMDKFSLFSVYFRIHGIENFILLGFNVSFDSEVYSKQNKYQRLI